MRITPLHNWNLSSDQARNLQTELSSQLILTEKSITPNLIAGCDVSSEWHGNTLFAAVVIMSFPDFRIIEIATASAQADFPYIPGLLSFREMPVLLKAWAKIENKPDLVFCDGSGLIHPRFFGLACHLGLWLNLPTIGAAKNLLCGTCAEPGNDKGAFSPVTHKNIIAGSAVRTRTGVKPVYVSPGNLISVDSATTAVLQTSSRYRLPEPVRAAHKAANEARRQYEDNHTG
ncbi:MAG: deoxyribonuclease V [FCB group bacterium]|nr:deoxyribonuclease V [FCB group bacterium]